MRLNERTNAASASSPFVLDVTAAGPRDLAGEGIGRPRSSREHGIPNHGAAQCLHFEPTAIFEVAGHRRSPLRWQRFRLLDDSVDDVRLEEATFRSTNGGNFSARGGKEGAALGAGQDRPNARARERRQAPDAGDEKELLPQHLNDVARDLVRDTALPECACDPPDPFGPRPAGLPKDDPAFAARAKYDTGADELERDV